jgi:hypothetical protein
MGSSGDGGARVGETFSGIVVYPVCHSSLSSADPTSHFLGVVFA